VQAEVTGDALREFMKEFDRVRAGDITQDEATKASLTMRNDAISEFEGLAGLLGAAEDRLVHGLPFASLGDDLAAMAAVNASELNELAGRAIPIERGVLVLVGDREVVLPQLEGLGLGEVEELDAWGEPAGE
jgi:predicted Zn-dependent peptidase